MRTVAPEGWLLKGGFALELRLGDMARTTKDIDVDWAIAEGESLDFLRRAAACDIGDFFCGLLRSQFSAVASGLPGLFPEAR